MNRTIVRVMFPLMVLVFVSLFSTGQALAATAYLAMDPGTVSVGDTILIRLVMDTMEKHPNTVEGTVLMKSGASNIEIRDFSLADSILTNWLKTPSLEDDSKISFIGGVPGGFSRKDALLFQIVFTAKAAGQVTFIPTDVKAYDNDGKATPIPAPGTPLTITISLKGDGKEKNQWLDVIRNDNNPPQDLSVAFGSDASSFGGKKFMSISAIDRESGIDYFEVTEGNQPAIRSGMTYVLRDQSESTPITVTAFDKAGNKSSILLHPDTGKKKYVLWAGGIIVLLFIGFVLLRRFKSMRKKNV